MLRFIIIPSFLKEKRKVGIMLEINREAMALYLESLKEDKIPIPEENLIFKSVQIAG